MNTNHKPRTKVKETDGKSECTVGLTGPEGRRCRHSWLWFRL